MAAMPDAATDHRTAVAERNVQSILDAAESLLERRKPASIAAVAKEAGVSRVTVYAHFATREDLLEAVVARAVAGTATALKQADLGRGPPTEALARLITVGWRDLDRSRSTAQAAAEQLSPEAMHRAHGTAFHALRELVERGKTDGVFRTDLPTDWLVTVCFSLMHAAGDEVRAGRLEPAEALVQLQATVAAAYAA
jgi:AcrR family transcriptional regulator